MDYITNIVSIKAWAGVVIGCIGSLFSELLGVHTRIMGVLVIFMALDYFTGFLVAAVYHKSNKSESGTVTSQAGFKGILRKGAMLAVIFVAVQLDIVLEVSYITPAVIYFFMANELVSLLENLGVMGVKYPDAVINAIEMLKKKSE